MMGAAAILAGGSGRRLGGVAKAFVEVGGVPILERQLAVLRRFCDEIVVVAKDAIPFAHFDVRVVMDEQPGLGPLGGLATALRLARADSLLVFACDMPFIDDKLVRALLDAPMADAIVATAEGEIHPLCARYSRRILPLIDEQLGSPDRSLKTLIAKLNTHLVVGDRRALCNLNTPEDYEVLHC